MNEFEKRGVQVLGCSVDSHFSQLRWKEMPVEKGGIGNIQYPLVADIDKSIARKYDVLLGTTPATVMTDDSEEETSVGGCPSNTFVGEKQADGSWKTVCKG